MASHGNRRLVVAGAGIAIGLVATALARRAGTGATQRDPAREVFLEARRERMRAARIELVTPRNGGPP